MKRRHENEDGTVSPTATTTSSRAASALGRMFAGIRAAFSPSPAGGVERGGVNSSASTPMPRKRERLSPEVDRDDSVPRPPPSPRLTAMPARSAVTTSAPPRGSVTAHTSMPPPPSLPLLRQMKSQRHGDATRFDQLLRRLSSYEQVRDAGYGGTTADYQEYLDYVQRVLVQARSLVSVSRIGGGGKVSSSSSASAAAETPTRVRREPPAVIVLDDSDTEEEKAEANVVVRKRLPTSDNVIALDESDSDDSVVEVVSSASKGEVAAVARAVPATPATSTFVRTAPRPERSTSEPEWLTQLRAKISNALRVTTAPVIITPVVVETPVFDRVERKHKEIDEDLQRRREEKPAVKVVKPARIPVDNFPKLPLEAAKTIAAALANRSSVIVENFGIPIAYGDLSRLEDREWLNDEVMNYYGQMIMARAKRLPNQYPDVHVFATFFYSKLQKEGYAGVRRWAKKFDLFSKKMILIPVHLGAHWCCACINFEQKRIEYYDSLHGDNRALFKNLRMYLAEEAKAKSKEFDESEWTDYCPKNIPAQENGYDCGVFTCIFAEYLSRREPFDFTQKHMPYLRNRMMYEILENRLTIE